jgi:molybdate transport system substrate-binding protein
MTARTCGLILLALLAAIARPSGAARGITIAAASDLQTVLPDLARQFERTSGITTTVTFGASGNFFAQIRNGAPFDVFLSADADYPRRLAEGGQVESSTLYEYATGRLVLWTRHDSGLDVNKGLVLLTDPRVRHVAVANPATAPYGRAAIAALHASGLFEATGRKLVYAENVAQAAQLAQSGNADVALIGHALAAGPALRAAGRFVDVPARLHPPIAQAAAVVSSSSNKAAAREFVGFLKSTAAKQTLRSYGFDLPGGITGGGA